MPKFAVWISDRLGTRKWAVCRASAKRSERYDCFLTQKAFQALRAEYNAAVAS